MKLLVLLKDFEDVFDSTLGKWKTESVDIKLKPDAKPVNSRYYPVPCINKENFKKELLCLVDIGVLEPVQSSEYGTPVFIIPKKEGTVRLLSDYRRHCTVVVASNVLLNFAWSKSSIRRKAFYGLIECAPIYPLVTVLE